MSAAVASATGMSASAGAEGVAGMANLAGSLCVVPGARPPCALQSSRRDWASRLAVGQTAAALPGLLASVFNLCSQAHRLSAVLSFVRALVRLDYLLVDISHGVELPRRNASIPRVILSESETLCLLEGPNVNRLAGLRDRAILEMLYATGLRNLELCHLDLADLDPAEGLVLVRNGKGGQDRKVPMGQEAWIWVEEYLAQCRPQWLSDASEQALFLGRFGKRLAKQDLTMMVARWAKRVGLEKRVTPHCLRHTCATHMLRRGASLRHLQVMLGHKSVVTTQVYTRVELSDLRKVLKRCHPRENLTR